LMYQSVTPIRTSSFSFFFFFLKKIVDNSKGQK
jgi:hypothetical protein